MTKYFERSLKLRKYKNVIDASKITFSFKKVCGLGVLTCVHLNGHKLSTRFSPIGFLCFIFWLVLYYFCAFKAFYEDQTVLRSLYTTKLKHYGDVFERIVSMVLVTYTSWKIPFDISIRPQYMEMALEIDDKIENMGLIIDYNKLAKIMLYLSLVQIVTFSSRMLSTWVTLFNLDMKMQFEVQFQASWADALVLVTTSHYCYYLMLLKGRYKIINDLLTEIKNKKSWETTLFVRSNKYVNMQKALNLQDKYVCEKIKACAGVYSLLFKACESIKDRYGFALVCTLMFCLFYIVLYLFYLMEATASGLFHDTEKYLYFLIYVFWQISYTFGVIFLNVRYSEAVVEEATRTSYVLHEIINSDISPAITSQAMQFSLQVLHQVPVFTACDLCKIDYELVFEGARSITTYLVIMLQFVME